MKNFKMLALLISILTSLQSFAEIKEARSMHEVAGYITPGALVIFDLDNTVLEAVQTLGTDQFFTFLVKKAEAQGLQGHFAKQKALELATPIQPVSRVRLVEGITKNFIRELQTRNYTVMALTARPASWTEGTLKQVTSLGIDFTRTAPPLSSGRFAGTPSGQYAGGVLFLPAGLEKGPTLLQFLHDRNLHPTQIIFVDDKLTNVQSVDASLTEARIPAIAIRYGAADLRVKNFDKDLAAFEYDYFLNTGVFLSDDDAYRMLK